MAAETKKDKIARYLASGGSIAPSPDGGFRAWHANGTSVIGFGQDDFGSQDEMLRYFQDELKGSSTEGIVGIGPNGEVYLDLRPQGQFGEQEQRQAEDAGVKPPPGSDGINVDGNNPRGSSARPASSGQQGGNARGATGGAARGAASNPYGPISQNQPSAPNFQNQQGNNQFNEGGGTQGTFIDPKDPLGIPPITPNGRPGSEYFQPGGAFPSAGNPFEGLDENSNLYDVIASMGGAQVANQQAALDTLGGVFNESLGGVSEGQRGLISDLQANPYSLDEATLQRIMGQNTAGINERAQRQMMEGQQRRASAGIRPDSGIAQAQDQQILTQAGQQAQNMESQARIQQATQNQQDIRSALQVGGNAIQQDIGLRERLANSAAQGVLGETAITGDAYLTNALLAAQGMQQNQQQAQQPRLPGGSGPGSIGAM